MTNVKELDWETLGAAWREQHPIAVLPPNLASRLHRQTWLMWATTSTEVLLFAGLAVFTWWYAGDSPSPARLGLLGLMWFLNIGIGAFSLWNRRGSWRAEAETTKAFVDLLHRRAVAKVRVARFVRLAVLLQAAVVVALVWLDSMPGSSMDRLRSATALAMAIAVAYLVWSAWFERRALRELEEALAARRMIRDTTDVDRLL
jgi:hypothetical protein